VVHLLSIVINCSGNIFSSNRPKPVAQEADAATASISRTHSQCQTASRIRGSTGRSRISRSSSLEIRGLAVRIISGIASSPALAGLEHFVQTALPFPSEMLVEPIGIEPMT
jgi:hypothetical protein